MTAGQAPVLERFALLAEYFKAGRKLTKTGQLTLADARELVAALGLDDRLEAEIGDHVYRARSAADLPKLSFTISWAVRAGVLRRLHGRLVATATWAKSKPSERFARAGQALIALGPLATFHTGVWPIFAQMSEIIDQTLPSLLARLAEGPVGYVDALDQLLEYLVETYKWPDRWADPGALRMIVDRDLTLTCELLEEAGIVAAAGPGEREETAAAVPVGEGEAEGRRVIIPTPAGKQLLSGLDLPARAPQVYAPVIAPSATVHELRIRLEHIEPEVWRTVVVPSEATLAALHLVVQAAMGWQDYHLHEFTAAGARYGVDDGEGWDDPPQDERSHRLGDVVGPGERLSYMYDFGDGWEHEIEVVLVRPTVPGEDVPRCTGGQRACPPEDVGGGGGYEDMLVALADRAHEEHDRYLEWVGGSFDPEHFDIAEVDLRLDKLRLAAVR